MGGVRPKRDHADFERAQIQLFRDTAGEGAMDRDVDLRELSPESIDRGEQVHTGVLIGSQIQLPALEALELSEGAGGLAAQSEQAQGIIAQKGAGRSQRAIACGAVEEGLA